MSLQIGIRALAIALLTLSLPGVWSGQAAADGTTWSPGPPLTVSRSNLAATTGPCPAPSTDTCLYAIGGFTNTEQSLVEIDDPAAGTGWTSSGVPQLDLARSGLAAATAPCPAPSIDTCIYAIGGLNRFSGGYLGLVEIYDPATGSGGQWTTSGVPQLGMARQDLAAATAPCPAPSTDTCVYALGGDNLGGLNTVEVYDPATGSGGAWTTSGVPQLSVPRLGLAAASAPCPTPSTDTCVYAMGGLSTGSQTPDNTVEAYDPSTGAGGQWSTSGVPQLVIARAFLAGTSGPCPSPDPDPRCLYAIGGTDANGTSYSSVEIYDPAQPGGVWDGAASKLGAATNGSAATAAPCPAPSADICLYAMGGISGSNTVDSTWMYDPLQFAWTMFGVPPPTTSVSGPAAATAPCPTPSADTCIYTIGFPGSSFSLAGTVSTYDPATGDSSWNAAPPLSVPRNLPATTSGPCPLAISKSDTCLYAIGGQGEGCSGNICALFPVDTVEVYDPEQASATWTSAVPQLAIATIVQGAVTAPCPAPSGDTCIYAVGGGFDTAPPGGLFTVQVYDPMQANGAWTTRSVPQLSVSLFGLAATVAPCPASIDTCIYAIGGIPVSGGVLASQPSGMVQIYDPEKANASWTTTGVPQLGVPRDGLAATTAPCVTGGDVCIYAIGGETSVGSGVLISTVEAYDPEGASRAWTMTGVPQLEIARLSPAVATAPCPAPLHGACPYAIGGGTSTERTSDTMEYLPLQGSPPAATTPLQIIRGGATTDSFGIALSPRLGDPCTGSFSGSGIPAGGALRTLSITGTYDGGTVHFLVRYAGSTAFYYGTLTGNGRGTGVGPGKDSGGVAHTYIASSHVLFQSSQLGCQDLALGAPQSLPAATVNKTATRTVGTVADPDGFNSANPDLAITVQFGDGARASCTGSSCFTASALAEHVRLINCAPAAVPTLPGMAAFPGVGLDTSCDVQATHLYRKASTGNGDMVMLAVVDKDQTTQPAVVSSPIQITGP